MCFCERAGHLQVALSLLLNAKDYDLPEFCVEWAEHQRAQVLNVSVDEEFSIMSMHYYRVPLMKHCYVYRKLFRKFVTLIS